MLVCQFHSVFINKVSHSWRRCAHFSWKSKFFTFSIFSPLIWVLGESLKQRERDSSLPLIPLTYRQKSKPKRIKKIKLCSITPLLYFHFLVFILCCFVNRTLWPKGLKYYVWKQCISSSILPSSLSLPYMYDWIATQ